MMLSLASRARFVAAASRAPAAVASATTHSALACTFNSSSSSSSSSSTSTSHACSFLLSPASSSLLSSSLSRSFTSPSTPSTFFSSSSSSPLRSASVTTSSTGPSASPSTSPSASSSPSPILSSSNNNSNNNNASARALIVKLLQTIGSKKEVEQYLKFYASIDTPKFAVIKVGGGILIDELDTLADSLTFLADVGLLPVVIHGAGPQLNDTLKAEGIVSDYVNGMRITTPGILRVARSVFQKANLTLVKALEQRGTRARPVVSGVFEAELMNQSQLGFVGQITRVDCAPVFHALEAGHLPILTCMGESTSGQILNINADVAAQELAKSMRPVKIVYLSQNGGINDESDKLIPVIDLDTDYDILMNAPWFRHGNRLKLREIKTLLDQLPPSSTVAITSAANLPKELFTHKGSGTLVRRSEKINIYNSMQEIDSGKLTALIEESFGGRLQSDYLNTMKPYIHRIYLSESYRAVAIVTKDPRDSTSIPYLDKFAVAKLSQSEGTGNALWQILARDNPQLYWRSRSVNPINGWYFERAQGSFTQAPWTVFWYGMQDFESTKALIAKAMEKKSTIERAPDAIAGNGAGEAHAAAAIERLSAAGASAGTASAAAVSGAPAGVRAYSTSSFSFSSSARSTASSGLRMNSSFRPSIVGTPTRRAYSTSRSTSFPAPAAAFAPASSLLPVSKVGLIGARGHTGAELIKIIDLKPDDLPFQDVDVWILALPNDLAAPYVKALARAKNEAKLVDLSADYRFAEDWQYGLPERHGFRERIRNAQRIANPGCYATGMQVSLLPILDLLDGEKHTVTCFGVSGYSGAGTTPSRKNDINELRDNLMPYALLNHMHEREVSHQLRTALPGGINFHPHVAPWFRGISLTISARLKPTPTPLAREAIIARYHAYFGTEKLVQISHDIPEVRANVGAHDVRVGGFVYDANTRRLVVTTTIDNLLKGAATQCIQNVNLALGLPEYAGIDFTPRDAGVEETEQA